MAAEVSSLVHHRTVASESVGDELTAPITRDLLGGSFKLPETQELDLDSQVPCGWEKRLDLKSGKVSVQRRDSPSSPLIPDLQDLNAPPPKKHLINLFGESSLDLKLASCNYQSVCTLDKVRFALERVEREPVRKRPSPSHSHSSTSSPSPIKETREEDENIEDRLSGSPVAAGCPGCLLYVLISKNNPRCPRCNAVVPMPTFKKPRIDLNMAI